MQKGQAVKRLSSGGRLAAILLDLGGTHLRFAVEFNCANPSPESLRHRQKSRIPNFLTMPPETVWDGLLEMICQYVKGVNGDVGPSDPIVLAFPGPIVANCNILAAPTIIGEGTDIPDIRKALSERTQRPVHMLNDMSAAAWRVSATSKAKRFVVVTISSGIGSKVFDRTSCLGVLDDVPYAGEIGHVLVDSSHGAPQCDCGGTGHLGAIASGRGIERAARQRAAHDGEAFRNSLCASKFGASSTDLNNEEHLVPAALAGDEWALGVIFRCTEPLAKTLAALTAAMGLDLIAVVGGFAQSLGSVYLEILEKSMENQHHFPSFPKFKSGFIEMQPPEDEVCLLGAATYAHRRLGVA